MRIDVSEKTNIAAWIKRNRENLLWGLAAVVIGVAFLAYTQRNKSKSPKGQWEYLQAVYTLSSGDTATALPVLEGLYQQYPNSRWGKRALYYLGYHYFTVGDMARAEDYWQKFLAKKPKDKFTVANAKAGLASVRMDQGRFEEAENLLRDAAAETPYETYKAFYTYRRGLCLEVAGNMADALKLYQEVKEKYEKTPLARQADARIKFVKAYLQAQQGG